jgi:hypothetical protein
LRDVYVIVLILATDQSSRCNSRTDVCVQNCGNGRPDRPRISHLNQRRCHPSPPTGPAGTTGSNQLIQSHGLHVLVPQVPLCSRPICHVTSFHVILLLHSVGTLSTKKNLLLGLYCRLYINIQDDLNISLYRKKVILEKAVNSEITPSRSAMWHGRFNQ